jgi:cellulose synthase A
MPLISWLFSQGTTCSYTRLLHGNFSGVEHDKVLPISPKNLEERFGPSSAFVASTFLESGGVTQPANANALLKEAIHVISCGYEDKSDWGKEVSYK